MSTELSDPPSEMSLGLTSSDSKLTEQTGSSVEPMLIQIHASKSQVCHIIEMKYHLLCQGQSQSNNHHVDSLNILIVLHPNMS